MAILPEHVGRVYGPGEAYTVTEQALADFATLLGFTDTASVGGHLATPTFPMTQTFSGILALVADPDIRLSLSHVVHSDQGFEYARPLKPGDVVRTSTEIESVRPFAGNMLVGLRSTVVDEHGDVLCRTLATIVVKPESDAEPEFDPDAKTVAAS